MHLFRRRRVRMFVAFAVVVLALWAGGVRLFAFPGESMSPAVRAGDHFVGMVGLWGMGSPERFEMVIFNVPPTSKWAARGIPWMKRLVGLPGEHVRLSGDQLFINGRKVDAPFLHVESKAELAKDFEVVLGDEEYCVLGDNLAHSFDDSRSMGPIARSLIKGHVALVIRPSPKSNAGKPR
jgi:signal peptidase I